jgi:hypothetical protein
MNLLARALAEQKLFQSFGNRRQVPYIVRSGFRTRGPTFPISVC